MSSSWRMKRSISWIRFLSWLTLAPMLHIRVLQLLEKTFLFEFIYLFVPVTPGRRHSHRSRSALLTFSPHKTCCFRKGKKRTSLSNNHATQNMGPNGEWSSESTINTSVATSSHRRYAVGRWVDVWTEPAWISAKLGEYVRHEYV